jgi:hypothetical protein
MAFLIFCLAGGLPAVFSINDTRQAAAFNGRLPKPTLPFRCNFNKLSKEAAAPSVGTAAPKKNRWIT